VSAASKNSEFFREKTQLFDRHASGESLTTLATWLAHCAASDADLQEQASRAFDQVALAFPLSLSGAPALLRYDVDVARVQRLLASAATVDAALALVGSVTQQAAKLTDNNAAHAAFLYNVAVKLQTHERFAESSDALAASMQCVAADDSATRVRVATALAYSELRLGRHAAALDAAAIAAEADTPVTRWLYAKASVLCGGDAAREVDVAAVLDAVARASASIDPLVLDLVALVCTRCASGVAEQFCAALQANRSAADTAKVMCEQIVAALRVAPDAQAPAVESQCRAFAALLNANADADADAAAQLADAAAQVHEALWAAAGARWRAGAFDSALELFELDEPLIPAHDAAQRACAQRMVATCSASLGMLDDAVKAIAIAKRLETASGALTAATVALEVRVALKRGDGDVARAAIKQIASLPLSPSERVEYLQLCAHTANEHGNSALCLAALTEALTASAQSPAAERAADDVSFGCLLRMLLLETIRGDVELASDDTISAVALVLQLAEPHLDSRITLDESVWLAGAAWRFGRSAMLRPAPLPAAVALFWSTCAQLECRIAASSASGDDAAAHVDVARMAASFAFGAAVELAWANKTPENVERVAVAEQRIAATGCNNSATMAQTQAYYAYLAALLRGDSVALAHAVDTALADSAASSAGHKVLETMASAALEANNGSVAFRLLEARIVRAAAHVSTLADDDVGQLANLTRLALQSAPSRDVALSVFQRVLVPLSARLGELDIMHAVATAWNHGAYLHRTQSAALDKCEKWLAVALELATKSPRARAAYEQQIRQGWALVVSQLKPGADAVAQQSIANQ
jgi:hypothetical protein